MVRKSDTVRDLVRRGEDQKALAIAKKFVLGISPEDKSSMVRAHECMVSPRFYQSLGVNVDEVIDKGVDVLKRIYG